jgi:Fe-S cluster assembly protein SufB
MKQEPKWMLNLRCEAFDAYTKLPMPNIKEIREINFDKLKIYEKPLKKENLWVNLPNKIRKSFEEAGLKQSASMLNGDMVQMQSESIYSNLSEDISNMGVIHTDTDTALKEYPDLVKKYFATVIPFNDHKIAALACAFWSGGSFVYVPKNVVVELPLHAAYGLQARNFGQFEHTIIAVEDGASVQCIEGCTSPVGIDQTLHAGTVEMIIGKNAKVKYSTIQNWSKNVYNIVTKRAYVDDGAELFWADCNIGSKFTFKNPTIFLNGKNSRAEIASISIASHGQVQKCGSKVIHNAQNTNSIIKSKTISCEGGKNIFAGMVEIKQNANNAKSYMHCESMVLDSLSVAESNPRIISAVNSANVSHEATISHIDENQLFYLQTKGFSKEKARSIIISGITNDIINLYPEYYAKRIRNLINMEI